MPWFDVILYSHVLTHIQIVNISKISWFVITIMHGTLQNWEIGFIVLNTFMLQGFFPLRSWWSHQMLYENDGLNLYTCYKKNEHNLPNISLIL